MDFDVHGAIPKHLNSRNKRIDTAVGYVRFTGFAPRGHVVRAGGDRKFSPLFESGAVRVSFVRGRSGRVKL